MQKKHQAVFGTSAVHHSNGSSGEVMADPAILHTAGHPAFCHPSEVRLPAQAIDQQKISGIKKGPANCRSFI
jgi:hypothetical protein